MMISLHRRHAISVGILWFLLVIFSMFVTVSEYSTGGLEGEYKAIFGFPLQVAIRRVDMWVPIIKQFSFMPLGILGNFIFAGLVAVGLVALIVLITQRGRK